MYSMSLILTPAYGRDYSSKEEVRNAWESENHDFKIQNPGIKGTYINQADAQSHNIESVIVRYNSKQDLVEINL